MSRRVSAADGGRRADARDALSAVVADHIASGSLVHHVPHYVSVCLGLLTGLPCRRPHGGRVFTAYTWPWENAGRS